MNPWYVWLARCGVAFSIDELDALRWHMWQEQMLQRFGVCPACGRAPTAVLALPRPTTSQLWNDIMRNDYRICDSLMHPWGEFISENDVMDRSWRPAGWEEFIRAMEERER